MRIYFPIPVAVPSTEGKCKSAQSQHYLLFTYRRHHLRGWVRDPRWPNDLTRKMLYTLIKRLPRTKPKRGSTNATGKRP
jgi:hypothetical protein